MYGETDRNRYPVHRRPGLSPHVRGNRRRLGKQDIYRGSIPACTGKPAPGSGCSHWGRVYPRMYGETGPVKRLVQLSVGLSPHVRGNQRGIRGAEAGGGSIPACTGKPSTTTSAARGPGVYPRMYGETRAKNVKEALGCGLSPHVRGNLGAPSDERRSKGSIPACTGKPMPQSRSQTRSKVYPRMYGETTSWE